MLERVRDTMSIVTETKYGIIEVTDQVIGLIAESVATRCYGVVGMTVKGKRDGIVNLLRKENMAKGVRVTQKDNVVSLELHIMVEHALILRQSQIILFRPSAIW